MNLKRIDEHTFDLDRITHGSAVLDVGCRNFTVTRGLRGLGCRVVSLDPDPGVGLPTDLPDVTFFRVALVEPKLAKDPTIHYSMWGNGTGNHVVTPDMHPQSPQLVQVATADIETIGRMAGVDHWAAVKLDCEGAEYNVLLNWPGPIADQISVEFHEHTNANPFKPDNERYWVELKRHMGQWYDFVKFDKGKQHGLPQDNYWDSLLVLR